MKRWIAAVIMVLVLIPAVRAQEIGVIFGDANLQEIVQAKLQDNFITASDMLILTDLQGGMQGITSLMGLENATNLTSLDLSHNQIIDISPLAGLTKLNTLDLYFNQIRDISPLAGLINLEQLRLMNNQISDLSPLTGLINLEYLHLSNNQISNISPLAGLTKLSMLNLYNNQISDISPLVTLADYCLEWVVLNDNPLNWEAYDTHIPELIAADITVDYDLSIPAAAFVPNVVGKSQTAAQQAVEAAGFTVSIVSASSETVPEDHVISQNPVGETWAALGSVVTLTVSTVPGPDLPALVAHWALDETAGLTAFDSAGSYDGRLYGNPTWQPDGGMIGGALQFDGVDDYVDCGTFNPSSATGKLTVCLWAKWDGLTGRYQGLIGKRDTWDAGQMMWQLEASQDWGMVGFFRNGSGSNDGFLMPVDQWVHISATCDGTTSQLYLDGQQVVSTPMTFGSDTASALVFGACEKNGGNPFNGTLDDIQLYDEVLNPEQIQAVMGLSIPGLVGHWRLDETQGAIAFDSAGANDGIVYGNATWLPDGGIFQGAIQFDGIDDYVEVARVVQDDFTLAAWIKTDVPGVNLGNHGFEGSGLMWSDTVGIADDFILAVLGTKLSFFCGNPDTSVNSDRDVVTGQWVHVAATRSAQDRQISIYLNGEHEKTLYHGNTGPLDAMETIAIGGNVLDSRYYNGLIDEVQFYDRVLNAQQIQAVMAGYPNSLGPAVEEGLVAHYAFEGNARDSSGNGLHGTTYGGPSYVDGILGQAISLAGNGDYVDCGNRPEFDISRNITVAAWIKVNEFDQTWQSIITKGDSAWRMQRSGAGSNIAFHCSGQSATFRAIGSANVDDGEWHHFAGVYDGQEIYLYMDGVLDVSVAAPGNISTNTEPVYIGGNSQKPSEGYRCWNGLIDEVRIYDRALSQEEIPDLL